MTSIDFQSLLRQEKAKQRAELLKISSQTKNDEEGRAAQSLSGSAFGVEDINTASKHTHPFDGAPNDSVRVETGGDNSALCNDTEREEPQAGCTGHDSTSLAFTGLSIRRPLDMETIRVGVTPSIFYAPDFVSEAEEQQILSNMYAFDTRPHKATIDGANSGGDAWVTLRSRRLQCWGGQPGEDFRAEPLPAWMEGLCNALVARGVFVEDERPNHVLINEYQPGQGIMPHTDGPYYAPRTATLSLGSDAIMHFSPRVAASDIGQPGVETRPQASIVLRERCLVVFAQDAYTRLLHGIDSVREETVGVGGGGVAGGDLDASINSAPAPVVINACAAAAPEGTLIRRKRRVSLTFRRVLACEAEAPVR